MHPLVGMSLECGFFAGVGSILNDLIISNNEKRFDFINFIIMTTWSSICFAPLAFCWYPYLEYLYPNNNIYSICIKLLMDQLLFSPILSCSFEFHSGLMMELNLNGAIISMKNNTIKSLITTWIYWPFVQIINIGYIPEKYQILVINMASIPWNIYVAYSISKQAAKKKESKNKGQLNWSLERICQFYLLPMSQRERINGLQKQSKKSSKL
eukprot:72049_1